VPVSRRRPPPLPELGKPWDQMTDEEKRADMRRALRVIRDDEVRRGARRPQTMREFDIAREGRVERDERLTRRAARAEGGQERRAES
jgi:hypothetical protein